ncbi:TIGR04283 family arsenosugar biosynthesis glycosyltransferase [soil metagenome]
MKISVSIIIPTLNEVNSLKPTLEALKNFGKNTEIIVVDGGSEDDTAAIAESYEVRVLHSNRGRGAQLDAGAKLANGNILWFLHADTIAPENAIEQIKNALNDKKIVGGNFTICFDGEGFWAKFLTRLYPQLRKIGLCYGDSAFFVRRETYEKIGGFKPLPLFEDLDFFKRLKSAGNVINLPEKVVTSSRRFENRSFILTFARWTIFQILYWLGVSPHTLGRFYMPIRKK